MVQAYAQTSSYGGGDVGFYEDVKSAMNKATIGYMMMRQESTSKAGEKQVGERAVRNLGLGSHNCGGTLVGFVERHNL